jgi:hypothetical protein
MKYNAIFILAFSPRFLPTAKKSVRRVCKMRSAIIYFTFLLAVARQSGQEAGLGAQSNGPEKSLFARGGKFRRTRLRAQQEASPLSSRQGLVKPNFSPRHLNGPTGNPLRKDPGPSVARWAQGPRISHPVQPKISSCPGPRRRCSRTGRCYRPGCSGV